MRHDRQLRESLLQLAAVVATLAAVVAVFQQSHGLFLGSALTAAVLLVVSILVWRGRRDGRGRSRVTRAERRALESYFRHSVDQFLRELPLPNLAAGSSLVTAIHNKSAYVTPPYNAYDASTASQRMRRRSGPADPVDLLTSLLDSRGSSIVIGEPGTGKTLVSALTFAALADRFSATRGRSLIPVFIRLNALEIAGAGGRENRSIVELLPGQLTLLDRERLQRLMDNGRFCFILDGLDELATARAPRHAVPSLPHELATFLEHPCVVTCREAFHSLYVDSDRISRSFECQVQLLFLTFDAQVVPFVKGYCTALGRPEFAAPVLGAVRANPRLEDILSRPLMLRMTTEVLCYELERGDQGLTERIRLTGSDYLSAEIYDRYVVTWIKREHSKATSPHFGPFEKISLIEAVAWRIFVEAVRGDTGYGSFELTDLLIDRPALIEVVDRWLRARAIDADPASVLSEIEERTFLIVSERGDTYRFAHKSFFEYLLARYVYDTLAIEVVDASAIRDLLSSPFPDEVIDFLRELLHYARTPQEDPRRRRRIEASLLAVLQDGERSEQTIMSRQQAANLLPIVATPPTRDYLCDVVAPGEHPFIRRAIAVGEALHHNNPRLLDAFVDEMNGSAVARDFHMGYNRIYYGDQPLSRISFLDDGAPECARFFRACVRHMEIERYRYTRSQALASVRFMLLDARRRALLVDQEREGLRRLRAMCEHRDGELGPQFDRERGALARLIDDVLAPGQAATSVDGGPDSGAELLEVRKGLVDDAVPAGNEQPGRAGQTHAAGDPHAADARASLAEHE